MTLSKIILLSSLVLCTMQSNGMDSLTGNVLQQTKELVSRSNGAKTALDNTLKLNALTLNALTIKKYDVESEELASYGRDIVDTLIDQSELLQRNIEILANNPRKSAATTAAKKSEAANRARALDKLIIDIDHTKEKLRKHKSNIQALASKIHSYYAQQYRFVKDATLDAEGQGNFTHNLSEQASAIKKCETVAKETEDILHEYFTFFSKTQRSQLGSGEKSTPTIDTQCAYNETRQIRPLREQIRMGNPTFQATAISPRSQAKIDTAIKRVDTPAIERPESPATVATPPAVESHEPPPLGVNLSSSPRSAFMRPTVSRPAPVIAILADE